jgi:hypothetical protein
MLRWCGLALLCAVGLAIPQFLPPADVAEQEQPTSVAFYARPYIAYQAPAQYNVPYHGRLIVRYASSLNTIRRMDVCANKQNDQVVACAYMDRLPRQCTIWIPKLGTKFKFFGDTFVIDEASFRSIWTHEMAHCNGWPHNHPGAH